MTRKFSNALRERLDVLGTAHKAVALRRKMKMSQTEFWRMVGVAQSAGSRYEAAAGPAWANARKIPAHVQAIGALVFAKNEQARQSVLELLVCEKWFPMDVACKGPEIPPNWRFPGEKSSQKKPRIGSCTNEVPAPKTRQTKSPKPPSASL